MSATTGTPAATPLKILKNEYFTHTDGSHRDQRQIWNVGEMAIVVQGIESTDRIQTYFAKKHLLTFKGGKASGKGLIDSSKMKDILNKRRNSADSSKYGPKLAGSMNTYILCDYLTPDELKNAFAKSLRAIAEAAKNKNRKIQGYNLAKIVFPKTCVVTMNSRGEEWAADACEVGFEKVKGKNIFVITHMEGPA